jgi:hypothetical protein
MSVVFCACSSKNDSDVLTFFSAFNQTLQAKSADVKGSISMKNLTASTIDFDLQFMQEDDLQLALSVDLSSGTNSVEDYLSFYIKDGKTYLNNLGTKSQSLAENIGLGDGMNLSSMNPFLDYTNDELLELFDGASHNGDVYTYTLDATQMSLLLDSMYTVKVSKADMTAVINDGLIESLTLYVAGNQEINEQNANFEIQIDLKVSSLNSVKSIDFPSDLSSY